MTTYSRRKMKEIKPNLSFPVSSVLKNPPANAGDHKRQRFNPWVGKTP